MIMTKDIAKAYAAEQQYYKDKDTQHSNVLNILDYIGPCGYDNYDEYYNDVQEYMLRIQNYEIKEVENVSEDCYVNYLQNKIPALVYNIHSDNNFAFVPNSFDKDDLFAKYNIIPQRMNYDANNGVIITSDGDLKMVIIVPDFIKLPKDYFLVKLYNYLSNYFDNVFIDNNDIMLHNKKIVGSGVQNINSMNVYMFQITFVDRAELIKQVCTSSVKEPGFIDENIISQEKLKNEIVSWLQQ